MADTFYPPVPDVPEDTSEQLRDFLARVKENIDLLAWWTAHYIPPETDTSGFLEIDDLPPQAGADENAPDPPTNFNVVKGTWYNILSWDYPTDSELVSHIEVWANTANNRNTATKIAVVTKPQDTYQHMPDNYTADMYYWIRCISYAGSYSTWIPTNAYGGELAPGYEAIGEQIDRIMDILKGTDPDQYDANIYYQAGELVLWTDGKRFRRLNYSIGVKGVDPTNSLYWERVGILYTGEVDGVSSVGIDGNLIVDGTILGRSIQADEIWGTHIGSNQIDASHIQSNSITSAKIAAGQVTATHVGTNEIVASAANIKNGIITSAKIGTGQITNALIANLAVDAAKIANATITGAKIASATVDTANITNAAIEEAKIGTAAVTMLKIGTNAVTVPGSDEMTTTSQPGNSTYTVLSVAINSYSQPVFINVGMRVVATFSGNGAGTITVKRGTTTLWSRAVACDQYEEIPEFHTSGMDESPPSGTNTYSVTVTAPTGYGLIFGGDGLGYMTVLGCKR